MLCTEAFVLQPDVVRGSKNGFCVDKDGAFQELLPVFLTHQPTERGDFCCILPPYKHFRNANAHSHHQSWQLSRRTSCQSATKVGTINLVDEQSVNQWGRAADSLCFYKSRASALLLVSFDYLFLHQRQSSAAADVLYSSLVSNTLPWRCRRLFGMKVRYKNIHGACWGADMQMQLRIRGWHPPDRQHMSRDPAKTEMEGKLLI